MVNEHRWLTTYVKGSIPFHRANNKQIKPKGKYMNTNTYRNSLTDNLCNTLKREKIMFNYIDSKDKVLDDEIVIWSGKRNGLKVVVCDSYIHGRDSFKVVKTGVVKGFFGEKMLDTTVYEGTSVKGVTSTVKRILDTFKKRREFYLKNKSK